MNKHLKCALKLLALPILLAYGLLVLVAVVLTLLAAGLITSIGKITGCFHIEEDDMLGSVTDFLLFPLVWFRQL